MVGEGQRLYRDELRGMTWAKEELSLFLVSAGAKPAAHMSVLTQASNAAELEAFRGKIESLLSVFGIKYETSPDCCYVSSKNPYGYLELAVAKCEENLDLLKNAQSDSDYGRAYGYPREAVEIFIDPGDKIHGLRGYHYHNCLADARRMGVEIPMAAAFIFHVPARWEIKGGSVVLDGESELLGKRYLELTKEKNPELASRVEAEFIRQLDERIRADRSIKDSFRRSARALLGKVKG